MSHKKPKITPNKPRIILFLFFIKNISTPKTIKISAKLKTGQNFRSIKSMTQPKIILSTRLEMAPESIMVIDRRFPLISLAFDDLDSMPDDTIHNKRVMAIKRTTKKPTPEIPKAIPSLQI